MRLHGWPAKRLPNADPSRRRVVGAKGIPANRWRVPRKGYRVIRAWRKTHAAKSETAPYLPSGPKEFEDLKRCGASISRTLHRAVSIHSAQLSFPDWAKPVVWLPFRIAMAYTLLALWGLESEVDLSAQLSTSKGSLLAPATDSSVAVPFARLVGRLAHAEGEWLVADIGGTHARFDRWADGRLKRGARRTYRNDQFADIAALIQRYREDSGSQSSQAMLAVASPISRRETLRSYESRLVGRCGNCPCWCRIDSPVPSQRSRRCGSRYLRPWTPARWRSVPVTLMKQHRSLSSASVPDWVPPLF